MRVRVFMRARVCVEWGYTRSCEYTRARARVRYILITFNLATYMEGHNVIYIHTYIRVCVEGTGGMGGIHTYTEHTYILHTYIHQHTYIHTYIRATD